MYTDIKIRVRTHPVIQQFNVKWSLSCQPTTVSISLKNATIKGRARCGILSEGGQQCPEQQINKTTTPRTSARRPRAPTFLPTHAQTLPALLALDSPLFTHSCILSRGHRGASRTPRCISRVPGRAESPNCLDPTIHQHRPHLAYRRAEAPSPADVLTGRQRGYCAGPHSTG